MRRIEERELADAYLSMVPRLATPLRHIERRRSWGERLFSLRPRRKTARACVGRGSCPICRMFDGDPCSRCFYRVLTALGIKSHYMADLEG